MRRVILVGLLLSTDAFAAPTTEIVSRSPPSLPRAAYALPPGSNHKCTGTVTIDANGVPKAVAVAGCDALFFPAMREALLLWRWRVRAFDEPIPPTLDVVVEVPFHVPELPSQTSTRIIRVPDSDGISNTAVASDAATPSNVVALSANPTQELTLEDALAQGLLVDHRMPGLRAPLSKPCTATVTFGGDGAPIHASPGDCPADVGADVLPALWRWRAVSGAQGSTRRVKVRFPAP